MTHLLSEEVFLLESLHEHIHNQVKMAGVLSLFISQTSQLVLVAQGSGFGQLCGAYVHVECSTEKWVGQCHITCMYEEVTCLTIRTHTAEAVSGTRSITFYHIYQFTQAAACQQTVYVETSKLNFQTKQLKYNFTELIRDNQSGQWVSSQNTRQNSFMEYCSSP